AAFVGDADAGDTVIAQPDRLREAGPDIDHVWHDGFPAEILRGLDGRLERLVVVVGDVLASVASVFGGELGDERPDGNHVRLLVAHGGDVAVEAFLVELFHVHMAMEQCSRRTKVTTSKIARQTYDGCSPSRPGYNLFRRAGSPGSRAGRTPAPLGRGEFDGSCFVCRIRLAS